MASSSNFKHLQAQRINTFTLPISNTNLTYYLQESESGSIIFVNYDIGDTNIYLPRLNGRSEDAGINFKFIFKLSNVNNEPSSTVTINSINDSLEASEIISSNNSLSFVDKIEYTNITYGQYVYFVSDGTYWTDLTFRFGMPIGIGTTNPDNLLHIKQNSDVEENYGNALRLESTDGKYHWNIGLTGGEDENDRGILHFINSEEIAAFIVGYENHEPNMKQLNFTGQHKNLMNNNIDTSKVGLIVSTTNNYINLDNSIIPNINESLPYCVLTNTDNDKKVFGVISDKEDNKNTREYSSGNIVSIFSKTNTNEQRFHINSLGEGAIWVCNKNGILENGDYIASTSVTGYGGKQTTNEGFLMNYTVAKITRDCDFSITKIVKQKLKVKETTIDGITSIEIDYDVNGDPQYEDDLDENNAEQWVYPLETRFLQADGTLLNDEDDYNTRLGNGETVYIACFVGCTYHCG